MNLKKITETNPTIIRHNHILKENLIKGEYYFGICRNARTARWDGEKFIHWRTKFGERFLEEIRCPEDENHYDVFFAYKLVDWGTEEIPLNPCRDV
jgi:hypothetical protein